MDVIPLVLTSVDPCNLCLHYSRVDHEFITKFIGKEQDATLHHTKMKKVIGYNICVDEPNFYAHKCLYKCQFWQSQKNH